MLLFALKGAVEFARADECGFDIQHLLRGEDSAAGSPVGEVAHIVRAADPCFRFDIQQKHRFTGQRQAGLCLIQLGGRTKVMRQVCGGRKVGITG